MPNFVLFADLQFVELHACNVRCKYLELAAMLVARPIKCLIRFR